MHAACGRKSKNCILPLVAFDVEWQAVLNGQTIRCVTYIGAWSVSASLLSKALAGQPVWSNFSGEGCDWQNPAGRR